MPARYVTASDGVRLAVFEDGAPEATSTVLLVHGYPDNHRVWDQITAELVAGGYHVVRYDVRGAGQSGTPGSLRGYRLEQLTDDLFAVAAAVGPVHLVGHDWGSIQSWHAVTDARAPGRIATFTSISGPSLDHASLWFRRRLTRPTPRHLAQAFGQLTRSWYIGVFRVPGAGPLLWRHLLGRRWPRQSATLMSDAINGIGLYRANFRSRARRGDQYSTRVPVQVITLTRDRYVSPSLAAEDIDQWVPRLTRRVLDATHWSALSAKAAAVARMIEGFASGEASTAAVSDVA